jgi:F0F1-type ATP synthase membrane subunit b/b'
MKRFARGFALSAARLGTFFVLLAAPALAQESQPKIEDSPVGQVFRWINFALVVAIILYLGRKAPTYFRAHSEEISQKIAEGARAREAAENRRAEVRAKLANISADIAQIREEAKKAAALEAERIRALAKMEAETIERAAQAEIAASEHAARVELKTLAARMAVDRAEALLKQQLQPKMEAERFLMYLPALALLVSRQQQAKT